MLGMTKSRFWNKSRLREKNTNMKGNKKTSQGFSSSFQYVVWAETG